MMLIVAAGWYIGILSIFVRHDFLAIENNVYINHPVSAFVRQIVFLPIYMVLLGMKSGELHSVRDVLLIIFPIVGLLNSIWWLLFDFILNRIRGLSWHHNGSFTGKKRSLFDRILHPVNPALQLALKLTMIAIFLILYIRI